MRARQSLRVRIRLLLLCLPLAVPASLHAQAARAADDGNATARISFMIAAGALLLALLIVIRNRWAASGGSHRVRPGTPVVLPPPPKHRQASPITPALGLAPDPDPASPPSAADWDDLVEGKTVRFYQPSSSGTLQLLPGRLEVVQGEDRGQNIRFVRAPGSDTQITFGRAEGPPHRHIQLRSQTVSREHARMQWGGDHWKIVNLSNTNPALVNGQELGMDGAGRTLHDGDQIEMGEVVFEFRER